MDRAGPEVDALWGRGRGSYQFVLARSSRHLSWRYLCCPSRQYRIWGAYAGQELCAYLIARERIVQRWPWMRMGSLVDLFAEPGARGCPMANAAVEITERSHPARKVIEAHKARLRAELAQLCTKVGAMDSRLLADQLFLLMEGAQVSIILGVRGPAKNVARAADALIRLHLAQGPQPEQKS